MLDILISRGMNICTKSNILPLYFTNCNFKLYALINIKRQNLRYLYTTAFYSYINTTQLKAAAAINHSHKLSYCELEFKDVNRSPRKDLSHCRRKSMPTPFVKTCLTSNINLDLKGAVKHSGSLVTDGQYTTKCSNWNENVYLPFQPHLKPVSPSLDDIQVKYSKCEDKTRHSETLGEKFLHSRTILTDKPKEKFELRDVDIISTTCSHSRHTNNHILYSSSNGVAPTGQGPPKELGKPSDEQLAKLCLELRNDLPALFTKTPNYLIYSKNIIFENRIRGTRSVGLADYARQLMILRVIGHLRFTYVNFEILKMTSHPEDSTIKVRWRIVGIPVLKSLVLIFRLKSYRLKDNVDQLDKWYDGFSTFYVGKDGRIIKHIADKMMPDEELGVVKKLSMADRLVSQFGLSAKRTPSAPEAAVTTSIKDKTDDGTLKSRITTSPLCVI